MFLRKHILALGLFALFLLVGAVLIDDYGISWDEMNMHGLGIDTYNHVFNGGEYSMKAARRFHGSLIEFFIVSVERTVGIDDKRTLFMFRHAVSFSLFAVGVYFFYLLIYYTWRNRGLAMLGAVMLVLSPRIFAHAFMNSRDIPHLTFFIISIYTLLRFLDRPRIISLLLHALACALAMSVRTTGIVLPVLTILFLFPQMVGARRTWERIRIFLLYSAMFLFAFFVLTVMLWPFLWDNTLLNLYDSLHATSNLRPARAWYVLPMWMLISIQISYVLCFIIGCIEFIFSFCRSIHKKTNLSPLRNMSIFMFWLFFPLLAIIILRAGTYDDWRLVFFVYPGFLLIALNGIRVVWEWGIKRLYIRYSLIVCLSCSFLLTSFWMIQNHPYQNVYFSVPYSFLGKRIQLDYWGLSYREALEYLVEYDSSSILPIHSSSSAGRFAHFILPEEDMKRIKDGSKEDANYIFYHHMNNGSISPYKPEDKLYSVYLHNGVVLMSLYKNLPNSSIQ